MGKGSEHHHLEKAVILAVALLLLHGEALASADIGGRLSLTYQKSRTPVSNEDFFFQHYRVTLRDKVFRQNDFALLLVLLDSKNLTLNRTFRRYDGRLDLSNHYWSFNYLFTPRQKITPLQLPTSREMSNNALNFDVHVPKAPRLRLRWLRRRNYSEGHLGADTRDLRGELSYQLKALFLRLDRWETRTRNGREQRTSSWGGEARFARSLGKWLNARAGYSYRFTEWRISAPNDATVQALDVGLNGRYQHYVSGAVNFSTRRMESDGTTQSKNRQDNNSIFVHFFPASSVSARVGRRYLLNRALVDQVSDYAEVQLLMAGDIIDGTTGRVTVSKRFDIESVELPVPADLFYVSILSELYRDIEFRGDVSMSRKNDDDPDGIYVINTVLDLFMRPRKNLRLGFFLRRQNVGNSISFVGSKRTGYGVDTSFSGRGGTTIGLSLGQLLIRNGTTREETTVSFTFAAQPSERTHVSLLYGVDKTQMEANEDPYVAPRSDRRNTLNAQITYRITRKGSIAVSYNGVGNGADRSNFVVTYRQQF